MNRVCIDFAWSFMIHASPLEIFWTYAFFDCLYSRVPIDAHFDCPYLDSNVCFLLGFIQKLLEARKENFVAIFGISL